MKTISIFLALINSLLAGLILTLVFSTTEIRQAPVWWSFTRVSAAACVILIALITWLASMRPLHAGLIPLCSLFLVALGASTIVWTFHSALISGDMEFHMIIYGGSLLVQGMASLFGFAGQERDVPTF